MTDEYTPEKPISQKMAKALLTLQECQGNRAEAAKRLGISAVELRQIIFMARKRLRRTGHYGEAANRPAPKKL